MRADLLARGGEIVVVGATEVDVSSEAEVLDVLWAGAQPRDGGDRHERAVVALAHHLRGQPEQRSAMSTGARSLSLVDLAGSERWRTVGRRTMYTAARVRELTSINQSLSALANCVNALLDPARRTCRTATPSSRACSRTRSAATAAR